MWNSVFHARNMENLPYINSSTLQWNPVFHIILNLFHYLIVELMKSSFSTLESGIQFYSLFVGNNIPVRGLPLVDEFPLIINVTHFWCRSDIVQLCNPSHKYLPTFAFLEKVEDIVTKLYKYSSQMCSKSYASYKALNFI